MKKEKVSEIISQIDPKYIDEATLFAAEGGGKAAHDEAFRVEKTGRKGFRRGVAAACLAVVLLLGSGAFMIRAEAKEYRSAVMFFAENGLPTEGLTRAEIKAVYRDITTKSFTYGKTAEVIRQAVPGFEIAQKEVTPEELSRWWERKDLVPADPDTFDPSVDPRLGPGFRYIREEIHGKNWDDQTGSFEKSILKCYRDRQLVWTAEFTDFWVRDCEHFAGETVVWGQTPSISSVQKEYPWLAFVDESGKILWQKRFDHAFGQEYVAAVLENSDGTFAVISRGDLKFVCLSCVDPNGNERSFAKTEVGNLGIWNAACLGDGYILHLGSYNEGDYAHLYRMDREGRLTQSFSYEDEECVYHITDMAEFAGQVYLSAYAVPETKGRFGRDEIGNILEDLLAREDHGMDISSQELTPLVRDNYTAVLLICDAESGEARTFWSVRGSLGGKLTVRDPERMEWDVESISSTFYSPATSSFTIGGVCDVFRYSFDATGRLTGQEETGETTQYRK